MQHTCLQLACMQPPTSRLATTSLSKMAQSGYDMYGFLQQLVCPTSVPQLICLLLRVCGGVCVTRIYGSACVSEGVVQAYGVYS